MCRKILQTNVINFFVDRGIVEKLSLSGWKKFGRTLEQMDNVVVADSNLFLPYGTVEVM